MLLKITDNSLIGKLAVAALAGCLLSISAYCGEEGQLNEATATNMIKVIKEEPVLSKMRAAWTLGQARYGSDAAIEAYRSLLKDNYAPARASAVYALGRCGNKSVLKDIEKTLKDKDETVRAEACIAISELAVPESATALPFSDPAKAVRHAALQAAVALGSEKPAGAISAQYANEKQPELRAEIIDTLSKISPESALDLVDKGLSDSEAVVRISALEWLSLHGKGKGEKFAGSVKAMLSDKSSFIRRAAAECYLNIGGNENDLFPLCKDKDHTVRSATASAMGKLGGDGSWQKLCEMQADAFREVRRAASFALLNFEKRDGANREKLEARAKDLLEKTSAEERMEGIWMLGEMKSLAGFPKLLDLAAKNLPSEKDADALGKFEAQDMRESALVMWVISRTGFNDGADLAMKYADAPGENGKSLRIHATRALGVMKHQPATAMLVGLLKRKRSAMGEVFYTYVGLERSNAIWAIGEIGDRSTLDTLAAIVLNTRPPEDPINIGSICDILAKAKYDNKNTIAKMRAVAEKDTGTETSSILADLVGKLTGKRPDVPVFNREDIQSETFLRTKE
ncbi:MAG: HEAT repeat domain-containing protein [Planctomycetes bacterium]|nr:HEAT repeat domain-containing protein [Planctomycetota bacterium]